MTDTKTELAELEQVDVRKIELAFIAGVAERELALWSRLTENLARAEAAMADAAKEPFVAGSTGQLTEHPASRSPLAAMSLRCGSTGCSPRGRMRRSRGWLRRCGELRCS